MQVVKAIHKLSPHQLETVGVQMLENYAEQKANQLHTVDITKRLEPYVNGKLKEFWRHVIPKDTLISSAVTGGLSTTYMGVTVERTVIELDSNGITDQWVLEHEYEGFANLLNKAADLGLIEFGLLLPPFSMAMAVISPSRRIMLFAYSFTRRTFKELRSYSNLFCNEGELAWKLNEIEFSDDGTFDYYYWVTKHNSI